MIKRGFDIRFKSEFNVKFYSYKNGIIKNIDHPANEDCSYSEQTCIIIPSYLGRMESSQHLANVLHIVDNILPTNTSCKLLLFIAVQWKIKGQEKLAYDRLAAIFHSNKPWHKISAFGLTLNADRKVDTLNTVISQFGEGNVKRYAWFDDDIFLEKDCFKNLLEYSQKYPNATVGSKKIGIRRRDFFSSLVYDMKKMVQPAMNYPHGCAIIVPSQVLKGGIPRHISCDDGYICYQMLDKSHSDPFHKLMIADASVCYHKVGAGKGKNAGRIRRMILHHWLLMLENPGKSYTYFRQSLFSGLWPITKGTICKKKGLIPIALTLKYIYLFYFFSIGIELILRGMFRRPIKRIEWVDTKIEE